MDKYQIGPAGGNGGNPFDHYDIPADSRLTAIHVYTEWVLNAIQFEFDSAGQPGKLPPIGGLGGEHHVFYLDDDEYLTGISGRAGWYIDSIRFHTNKKISPMFGGKGGERDFSFEAPAGFEVSGLFGRSAWYMDALGVSVRRQVEKSPFDAEEDWDDEEEGSESWLELAGEGEPLPASVVVRRQIIATNEDLDNLEDTALAEAIAGLGGNETEEGTVDAAVYTQVIEDADSSQKVAVVMAVAAEVGSVETVGDEPEEIAVMVTDALDSEDDLHFLEEEAVEGAIDMLMDEIDEDTDEVEVTIYSGITPDDASGLYGAVVAIATKVALSADSSRMALEIGDEIKEARPKDLEKIEGIGPKIAELLIAHDIFDLVDLAATPVDRLREILGAAGRRFRLADPGSWPEQATLAAGGLWDKLTELQTRLKAGR